MHITEAAVHKSKTRTLHLVEWLGDPVGLIIFASAIAIGGLAIVDSGIRVVDALLA